MNTALNILYGVLNGIIIFVLSLTALASIMRDVNLFGYPKFWVILLPLLVATLYIHKKRGA